MLDSENEVIFLLGAGASVPAGINDMTSLINDLIDSLKNNNNKEELEEVSGIKKNLEQWIEVNKLDKNVDIELIMEAVDKLENKKNEFIINFCNDPEIKIDLKNDKHLSKYIKQFIRIKCFTLQCKIDYFKYLMEFFSSDELNIFSTNYDNAIEQFCEKYDIKCIDKIIPFPEDIQPTKFKKIINLYKLHGSITWWRNEQGDLINIPLINTSEVITTSLRILAVPIILYPGKKIQYFQAFS